MSERPGVAAHRPRETRFRCHWRPQQLSVRMAVVTALHHSVQRRPNLVVSTQTLDEFARHVDVPMLEIFEKQIVMLPMPLIMED